MKADIVETLSIGTVQTNPESSNLTNYIELPLSPTEPVAFSSRAPL